MQENIIAGLVSGFVVTLFVLVFRQFWNAVIVPWFEDRVYKDVRIEGKWFGLYPGSKDLRQDVIVLKRHGHSVQGKIICSKGGDEGDEYSVCGSFRNMLLPLVYESTDKTKTDRGSITLRCTTNGERLTGQIALYSTFEDSVIPGSITWFRSKKDLDAMVERIQKREEKMKELKEERRRIAKEESEIENRDTIEGEVIDLNESAANKQMQPNANASAD